MKRHILLAISLSTLLISPAQANPYRREPQTMTYNPTVVNSGDSISQINPFNLAYMAYRGFLEDEGIPSGDRLIEDFESGRFTAKDIFEGAVKAHRLSEEALSDPEYLNALEEQLRSFGQD